MAETLPQRLQRAANRFLAPFGLHVLRRERAFDMDGLLARAAVRGPTIATWIDVGASDGSWSVRAHRHFPSAQFLLFEPLTERAEALRALKLHRGFDFVPAAAGAVSGSVPFAVDPELDGSSVAGENAPDTRMIPVEAIDHAVAVRGLKAPFGIKLDTHGYEIPVLEGAKAVLESTELVIIEAYNFHLTSTSLRFPQLCGWLEERGFRPLDLADVMRRPGDGALWQLDLAFVRKTHPAFSSNSYV